jgi:hypothetical protein
MKDADRLAHMLEMSRTIVSLVSNREKEDVLSDRRWLWR